ncbi:MULTISPECIES: signal peptidase I [unclassified Nocardioides]|uniref:signal peptidase I n=1 Tax=unclassified Nocardioides TaxID=2615069 RepID=UPI0006FC4CF5|nr:MULTISPECIES: signal peptidase I [unclassified Nocardioides]KRA32651.1 hypothetical protein ASD81_14085 [Nocardioides sp. Root614]KRA89304.1 hypothetical protein ASD84_14350 [Nocardioides sp. Root682]
MTKTLRFGREALLWVGGALGTLCLLSLLAGWMFNVTPLVFSSGSMSPAYEAGALGLAHEVPAPDLEVGDVVSVVNAQGDRVTHRIVETVPVGNGSVLTLQGDTNNVPDAEAYAVTSADRVSFGIPYAGYVLNAAASPFGLLVIALLVGASMWLGFARRQDRSNASGPVRTRALVSTGVVGVVAAGVLLGASGQAPWAFTSAFWTDTATATTTASTPAVVDTTPPVLSNPLPANASSGAGWAALSCASSANQICVNATDTGGSGVSTVFVKLVRTSTNQCWNGTAFIAGTGCSPQPMVLVAGNQYSTSGLTAALMPVGTYTAAFTATDVAGNAATPLNTGFTITVPATPTITSCTVANGLTEYTLTWTWPGPGTADSFKLYYGGGGSSRPPTTLPDVTSPYTGVSVPINDEAGTFRIVAVVGGVESALSNTYNYSGKNNSKVCGP